jgi:hypothetical protein
LGDEIRQEESVSFEIFGVGNLGPLAGVGASFLDFLEAGIDECKCPLKVVWADRSVVHFVESGLKKAQAVYEVIDVPDREAGG